MESDLEATIKSQTVSLTQNFKCTHAVIDPWSTSEVRSDADYPFTKSTEFPSGERHGFQNCHWYQSDSEPQLPTGSVRRQTKHVPAQLDKTISEPTFHNL